MADAYLRSAEPKPAAARKGRHSAPTRPSPLVLAQASSTSHAHTHDSLLTAPLPSISPSTAAPSPSLPVLALPEPSEGGRSRAASDGGPPDLTLDAASEDGARSMSARSESTVPLGPEADGEEEGMSTWNSDAPMSEGAAYEEMSADAQPRALDEDVEMHGAENGAPHSEHDALASSLAFSSAPASTPAPADADAAAPSQASGLVASTSEAALQPDAQMSDVGSGSAGAPLDVLMGDASNSSAPSLAPPAPAVAPPIKRGRGRPKKIVAPPATPGLPLPTAGLGTATSSAFVSPLLSSTPLPLTPSSDAGGRPRRSAAPTASMDLKQRRKPRASPSLGGGGGGQSSTPVREREPQAEQAAQLTPNTKLMIPLTDTASAEAMNEARKFTVPSPKKKEQKSARVATPGAAAAGTTNGAATAPKGEEEMSTLVTKSGGVEKTEALVSCSRAQIERHRE